MTEITIDEGAREQWHCSICRTPDLCLIIRIKNDEAIHMCTKCEAEGLAMIAKLMANATV